MQVLVIGAGVVGLAVARAAARKGHDVVVAEAANAIGTGISSRNSEVIHGGMYYPTGTLRGRHCVAGRRMLYEFCAAHGVPHRKCGKLVVATNEVEFEKIHAIEAQGKINGVEGLDMFGANAARALEPELSCIGALHSPETGIIDSHRYMLALRGDLEDAGGAIAFNTPVQGAARKNGQWRVAFGGNGGSVRLRRRWSIAPGLGAQAVARAMEDYPATRVPRLVLGKGNYFSFAGKPAFTRLIYPTPIVGGLGVHVTLDLAGRMRFGPDVEWVDSENYDVKPARAELVLCAHPHLLARPAGRLAGAGLFRHKAQAHRAGRAAGGFFDRHAGAARLAGAGADVRDRVAGTYLVAVAGRGSGRLSRQLSAAVVVAAASLRHDDVGRVDADRRRHDFHAGKLLARALGDGAGVFERREFRHFVFHRRDRH